MVGGRDTVVHRSARSMSSSMLPMERSVRMAVLVVSCFLLAPTQSILSSKSWEGVASEGLARSTRKQPSSVIGRMWGFVPAAPSLIPERAELFRPTVDAADVVLDRKCTRPLSARQAMRRLRAPLYIRMDGTDDGRGLEPRKLGSSAGQGFSVGKGKRQRVKAEDLEMAAELQPEVTIPPIPVYNWSVFGLDSESIGTAPFAVAPVTVEIPEADDDAKNYQNDPFSNSEDGDDRGIDGERVDQLEKEIQMLREEHKDINEVTDRLAELGRAGSSHAAGQVRALKKRKLLLKDRIAGLEAELERALRGEEESEDVEEEAGEEEAEEGALREMIGLLGERGLRPDSVPPHKDSYFLALMKALQRAGLRPRGYDFREAEVEGSRRQFPYAAKRAKHEVLGLLASQVHKLNRIGGWQLSGAEFKRYFSKAWWNVAAARHDLLMASAHLFSVRIVALSISPAGLEQDTYDPPGGNPRATVHLCRRADHVISTVPKSSAVKHVALAPPPPSEVLPDAEALRSLPPPLVQPARVEVEASEEEEDDDDDGLDAGLGLLDEVEEDAGELTEEDVEEEEASGEVEDDEVMDAERFRDRIGAMYGGEVAMKRLFVAVTLDEEAKGRVMAMVEAMRRCFPLEGKALERALRWVEGDSLHVTLNSLEVRAEELYDVEAAVEAAVQGMRLKPFVLRTGKVGCFWRSAGSGWGRLPRVVWVGLEEGGLGPLLQLHRAVGEACVEEGWEASGRPLCAHITVAKTRSGEEMGREERRTLRAFGKWVQDAERPVALQRALQERAERGGREGGAARIAEGKKGQRRGAKRFKSWVGKKGGVKVVGGAGKGGVRLGHRHHRRQERDLGGMNAELAEEWVEEALAMASGKVDAEIAVGGISLIEAVRRRGTNLVEYKTVARIPLSPEPEPPARSSVPPAEEGDSEGESDDWDDLLGLA